MHAMLLAALLARRVDAAVDLVMRTQHIAGLSLGIEHDGRVLYGQGYGQRDLRLGLAAEAGTVYRIGSLTKSFTAAAILRLVDQHRISLNDPIAKYVTVPQSYRAITVGELLAHTSGIPSYSDLPQLDRSKSYSPQQLVDAAAAQPLAFSPGSQFAYSNTNYVLLGMIAQDASGAEYGDYLQSEFFAPLGLYNTRYGDQAGEATGYRWDGGFIPAARSSTSYAFSAAGLSSNVPDLLRWLDRLPDSTFGFLRTDFYGYPIRYASGNVDGYSAFDFIAPGVHDNVVILTNADGIDLLPLAKSLFALIETPKPGTYAAGFGPPRNEDPKITAEIRGLLSELQDGTIDRSALTARYSANLSQNDLDRFAALLAPMGALTLLEFTGSQSTDGATNLEYRASYSNGKRIIISVRFDGDAIDGVTIAPD